MNTSNQEKLNKIFAKVFDNDHLVIEPHMTANDVDGWDSMSHLKLIVTVEKEFGIKISGSEVMKLKNVGDLLNLVNLKTGQ
ncbi:MAG: acyl carrier protein [Bacteroidia bacterium]